MKYFGEGLSEKHKELNRLLHAKKSAEEAKRLFLELHAALHPSVMLGSGLEPNCLDDFFSDLSPEECCVMPTAKDETIAWVLWHIARIEDITMNILVGEADEIFTPAWKECLHVSITDPGNALTDDEIIRLSKRIDIETLFAYRNAVGRRTREVVRGLTQVDLTRKVTQAGLQKIKLQGGVTQQEESVWLLDFWEKKDVAGILLMPPTRHVMLHLNDCFKWKQHIRAGKKCYRTE